MVVRKWVDFLKIGLINKVSNNVKERWIIKRYKLKLRCSWRVPEVCLVMNTSSTLWVSQHPLKLSRNDIFIGSIQSAVLRARHPLTCLVGCYREHKAQGIIN